MKDLLEILCLIGGKSFKLVGDLFKSKKRNKVLDYIRQSSNSATTIEDIISDIGIKRQKLIPILKELESEELIIDFGKDIDSASRFYLIRSTW